MALSILTYTTIQQFKNCRRLFFNRNIMRLVPRVERQPRLLGKAIHVGLETGNIQKALSFFDQLQPTTQEEMNQIDTDRVIVQGMLEGYFQRFGFGFPDAEKFLPEAKFEIPIINPCTNSKSRSFLLAGKADGLALLEDTWWIVEYKTASQIPKTYIDRLMLDNQVTTYIYGLQKYYNIEIAGVIYRVLRKPSIRLNKKETIQQYQNRIIQDYRERPDFYFYEEKLYRSKDDLAEYKAELWQLTQDILKCQKENRWYKNTSRCADWQSCEYIPICAMQPDAHLMFKKAELNLELQEGSDYVAVAGF